MCVVFFFCFSLTFFSFQHNIFLFLSRLCPLFQFILKNVMQNGAGWAKTEEEYITVKYLLQQEQAFLQIVFEEWKENIMVHSPHSFFVHNEVLNDVYLKLKYSFWNWPLDARMVRMFALELTSVTIFLCNKFLLLDWLLFLWSFGYA